MYEAKNDLLGQALTIVITITAIIDTSSGVIRDPCVGSKYSSITRIDGYKDSITLIVCNAATG